MSKASHENNFNALRLCAALLVFFAHSFMVYDYSPPMLFKSDSVLGIDLGTFGVTIFFVISGFLVTQSWLNLKRVDLFLLNRAVRIYPALLAYITIKKGALLVGALLLLLIAQPPPPNLQENPVPLATTMIQPKQESFSDLLSKAVPQILQRITFFGIPDGLSFFDNPFLWTLPYEILCYSILCLLCFFINPRKSIPLFTILYCSLFYNKIFFPSAIDGGIINFAYIHCATFCIGACFYIYREKIRFRKEFALLAFITLVFISSYDIKFYPAYILSVAYLVLYIAFTERKFIFSFSKKTDISYGVYIYSAPTQIISAMYVNTLNISSLALEFTLYIMISLLFTVSFAYASWSYIEKPALRLKKFWIVKK